MKSFSDVLKFCNDKQINYTATYGMLEWKTDAFIRALNMFPENIKDIVEIGYEPLFEPIYSKLGMTVKGFNLPDTDMHYFAEVDLKAVFARHTLEHSPIPLLVIMNVYDSLVENGYFLVVVPKAETDYILKHPTHFTSLAKEAWEHLFAFAKFTIVKYEEDKWDGTHYEHRFLLQKKLQTD